MSAGGDALGIAIRDAINAIPLGTTYDAAKRDQIMKGVGNAIYDSGGLTPVTHTHDGVSPNGPKLVQANTHETPDTDAAAGSLHHTIGAGANQACGGADARLSDARTPLAHNQAQSTSHDSPDTDVAPGSLHHTLGVGANQACAGNDARLSDARTPLSHGIADSAKHTSGITADRILVSDANGLPSGTIYTNANLASAVGNAHNQFLWPQYSTPVSVSAASTRIIVGVSDTSAPRTVTLLTSQCVAGRIYHIKDESLAASVANYVKIVGQGGQLIDGLAEIRIVTPGGAVWLYSNGTAWFMHSVEKNVLARETTAASLTASIYADIIGVTDTAAERIITLPTSQVAIPGRVYAITDESGAADAFPIKVVGEAGELVSGAAQQYIGSSAALRLYATGTAWRVC